MKYFSAHFYYVRYSILGQIIHYTFRFFSWRVFFSTLLFLLLYFTNQLLHLVFRAIDFIFFYRYRQQVITAPVFIIANPRSGTTYLHRLMSLDRERFTYTQFAHTFYMTVSFTHLANGVKWLDAHTGNLIRKIIDAIDDRLWGGWDNIHSMGFNKPEEDELPFAQMMMSSGLLIPFPFLHLIHGNKFLDREEDTVKQNTMDYYESCVKRYVYASGKNKTYLAKNVNSMGRIKSILERFPDAKIIYLVRHPYQALPSMTSMFTSMLGPISPTHPAIKAWTQLGIDYYLHMNEVKRNFPASQFIVIKYDQLIAKPLETVTQVYQDGGWILSKQLEQRLEQHLTDHHIYESKHNYSLEYYGLSPQMIQDALPDIFEEYGFER